MNLTQEEKDLFTHIDGLLPQDGVLKYDFRDPKQYAFAKMLTEKHLDPNRYPGAYKKLEFTKLNHENNDGVTPSFNDTQEDANLGWIDMFAIPGLSLSNPGNIAASNGVATIVKGYSSMNLGLFVQNNETQNIVANGSANDFTGKLLPITTAAAGAGSSDMNVTSYLHYSYSIGNDAPISGVVKRAAGSGAVADPVVSAPVRRTTNPKNPNAINIGLGRAWSDQGGNSQFDYAWSEANQNHPVGKIPFIGNVTFGTSIKSPIVAGTTLILDIYVADKSGGGGAKLDATNLATVYNNFSIDPTNPNTLKWNLPPGISTTDSGTPITFGNVTWNSDIEAFFYCGITVVLSDGSLGFAAVQSKMEADQDALDGIKEIMPIDFIWHCLVEDTKVLMSNGKEKLIQDIIAGEDVMLNNTNTSATVLWTNKGAHKGNVSKITVHLNNEIISSHNHVFITKNGAVKANELVIGDQISTTDGFVTIVQVDHNYQYNGLMYNLATQDYTAAHEFDGNISTFVANGFVVGDINAQQGLEHQRKNDINWIKNQLPEFLHQDVQSHFEDNNYKTR